MGEMFNHSFQSSSVLADYRFPKPQHLFLSPALKLLAPASVYQLSFLFFLLILDVHILITKGEATICRWQSPILMRWLFCIVPSA